VCGCWHVRVWLLACVCVWLLACACVAVGMCVWLLACACVAADILRKTVQVCSAADFA